MEMKSICCDSAVWIPFEMLLGLSQTLTDTQGKEPFLVLGMALARWVGHSHGIALFKLLGNLCRRNPHGINVCYICRRSPLFCGISPQSPVAAQSKRDGMKATHEKCLTHAGRVSEMDREHASNHENPGVCLITTRT